MNAIERAENILVNAGTKATKSLEKSLATMVRKLKTEKISVRRLRTGMGTFVMDIDGPFLRESDGEEYEVDNHWWTDYFHVRRPDDRVQGVSEKADIILREIVEIMELIVITRYLNDIYLEFPE